MRVGGKEESKTEGVIPGDGRGRKMGKRVGKERDRVGVELTCLRFM